MMASVSPRSERAGAAATSEQASGLPAARFIRQRSAGNGRSRAEMAQLARALGWFSLGLGLAQVAAPGRVAGLVGLDSGDRTRALVRAAGLREIASGIGILTRSEPTPWLWTRVGGDAMDLALLSSAMDSPSADRNRLAAATAAVVGVTVADALCSTQLGSAPDHSEDGATGASTVPVTAAITVNAPIGQVFQAWEGFRNLPRFMGDFASVHVSDDRASHWSASLPAGISLAWDVQITESVPNERIAWRTGEGSPVTASGEIGFRPAPRERGTEILFQAEFSPPGGELGKTVGGLFSDAIGQKIQNDLRRFKQLTELGEIVQSDDSIVKGPNPARPTPANATA